MSKERIRENDSGARQARYAAAVDDSPLSFTTTEQTFTKTKLQQFPYRCPQYLEWLWERYDELEPIAEEIGTRPETVSDWLAAFGVREKCEGFSNYHAAKIEQLSPEDVGLEPVPEPEGSV